MEKRIKAGVRIELEGGDWLETDPKAMKNGAAVLRDPLRVWRLSAEDIRRIQAADLLEDVPEPKTPGQVLHESLLSVEVLTETVWSGCARVYKDRMEKAAARNLGIKPEGE